MNRFIKLIFINVGILIIFQTLYSQNNGLKVFINSTIANEPNLKLGSRMFLSNVVSPKIGNFISYNYVDNTSKRETRIHRICGMENDTLEIINGLVFLNKINIDSNIDHIHAYKIAEKLYKEIKLVENISDDFFAFKIDENNVICYISDLVADKYKVTSARQIEEKGQVNEYIKSIYKKDWNKDNFGPLIIPKGKLFLIGDNRDNSEDSRFIGLIDKSDILSVLIGN